MIVGKDYVFVHIPRTSGSSLELALVSRDYGKEFNFIHYAFSDEPCRLPPTINKFVFTLVRNPFEKEFSHWLYHTEKPEFKKPISFKQWVLWRYGDYELESKYLCKTRFEYGYLNTFDVNPMLGYIIDRDLNLRVTYIGNFENREHDTKYIFNTIKLNQDWEEYPLEEGNRTKIPTKSWPEYYDLETKEIIENAFSTDLKAFGYSFDQRESFTPNSVNLDLIKDYSFLGDISPLGYNRKGRK